MCAIPVLVVVLFLDYRTTVTTVVPQWQYSSVQSGTAGGVGGRWEVVLACWPSLLNVNKLPASQSCCQLFGHQSAHVILVRPHLEVDLDLEVVMEVMVEVEVM